MGRVQSSSSEATEAELPSSSGSNSSSSSSTPEPDQLPTRPPTRRAALAATALRKKALKTGQKSKVKSNGQIPRRPGRPRLKKRWRSVSPPTSSVTSLASSDATPPTQLIASSTPTPKSDTVAITTLEINNVT